MKDLVPHVNGAAAAPQPVPFSPEAYAQQLKALDSRQLLAVYEAAVVDFAAEDSVGFNVERLRLARREILTRMPPVPTSGVTAS